MHSTTRIRIAIKKAGNRLVRLTPALDIKDQRRAVDDGSVLGITLRLESGNREQ
jgi:hypothetical protein